jgi:hypothetical protein
MNADQSLKLIEEMISSAKADFSDNGFYFLLWGWLVLIAAVTNYVLLMVFQYSNHWIFWPVLMTIGGVVTGVMSFKEKKEKKAESLLNRIIGNLWLSIGLSIGVLLIIMTQIGAQQAYPFFMLLYGIGTFVTGRAVRFLPLVIGGISCFFISGLSAFQDFPNQLILMSVAIVLSYLIPGHMLFAKSKQHV